MMTFLKPNFSRFSCVSIIVIVIINFSEMERSSILYNSKEFFSYFCMKT